MQKTQFKGVFLLLLTAFIWGVAFVAQSEGMEHIDAFSFSGIRMVFGVCVLLPFIIIRDKMQNKKLPDDKKIKLFDKKLLVCGSMLGVVFFFACNLQQFAPMLPIERTFGTTDDENRGNTQMDKA